MSDTSTPHETANQQDESAAPQSTQPESPQEESPGRLGLIDISLYRLLLVLMVGVAIGAVTTIAGEMVFNNPAIKDVGFSITVTAAGLYFAARAIGRARGLSVNEPLRRQRAHRNQVKNGGGAS